MKLRYILLAAFCPALVNAALQAEFDQTGIKSLKYGNHEFFYHTGKLPDGVTAKYRVEGDKLMMEITTTNAGPVNIKPFAMQFPKKPKGWPWIANGSLTGDNVGAPTILTADWGDGAVVACNEQIDQHCRFGWQPVHNAKVVAREVVVETFPDTTAQTFTFSFRFGARPDSATDIREKFVKAYPPTFDWPDRRPIQAVFLANSGQNWPGNPRGYFNDAKMDVNTEAGKTKFRERLMKIADDSIATTKDVGGQGVIVWDIEGGEMPHAVTYLGDPRVLPAVAPEMDAVADEFFKKFRDAELKVGICIRPSKIVFKEAGKYPWIKGRYGHLDGADPVGELADKIAYAKKRWGCSIFYMDTNYTPLRYNGEMVRNKSGSPEFRMLTAAEMQELHRRCSDAMIWPEFQSTGYFASMTGYGEYHSVGRFSEEARKFYPSAFRVWMPRLTADEIYARWDEFVEKGVKAGEVFLFEGRGPTGQALRNAYAEAKETRQPPKELPALLDALKSETDWAYRRRIITALGAFTNASAAATLADILKSDKSGLEIFAGRALGRQGALGVLTNALPSKAAVYGLGTSGKVEAVEPLIVLLTKKTNQDVRWAVLAALGELQQGEAVPALLEFLKSLAGTPAEKSRELTIATLGAIGDKRAVATLIEAMGAEEYSRLRSKIGDALVKITGFDGGTDSAYDVKTWRKWQENNSK